MSNTKTQTPGGMGCLTIPLFYLLLVAGHTAYQWSTGINAREALALSWGFAAWWTGGLCFAPVAFIAGISLVGAVLSARRSRRGW